MGIWITLFPAGGVMKLQECIYRSFLITDFEWSIPKTSYFTKQHVHCWASGYCASLIFRFWTGFTQRIKKAKCFILGCPHSVSIVLQCELQSCRIAIRETYFQLNSYSVVSNVMQV